jgi:UDP-glucose-4-epimerase GalE
MAKVLVTGGAGYIGSHACKRLAEAGHIPVCFDNYGTGWRDAVRFGPALEGDLLDRISIAEALREVRPDAVMHFAALSLVGESVVEPARYWRGNLIGALNLLDAMREVGVDALIFSSTAATYGEPDVDLIEETTRQSPTNPYGQTKLAIERLIGDYAAAYGLRSCVFRYFNVAGADPSGEIGEWHRPETHLIPIVLETALGTRSQIIVNGLDYPTLDGACVRDYLHVCDLVDAHLLGLERLLAGGSGATVNLGVGRGRSVLEVIAAARAVTDCEIPYGVGPRRAGDPPRLVCSGAAARRELGWKPTRSDLETMIGDAWRWAQSGGYRR